MPLGKPLLDALERMGHGGLIIDCTGQVLQVNNIGIHILSEYTPTAAQVDGLVAGREALKALLRFDGASRFRMDQDSWVVVHRDAKRPLIIRAVPIADTAASGPHSVIILVDLGRTPQPTSEALQKIFALTPTEARLAMQLACGKNPDEIATASNTAIGTVRKQIASIFSKTNTHRQSELVALLARVSILP